MTHRRIGQAEIRKSKKRKAVAERVLRFEPLEQRRLLAVIGNNLEVGDELRNYRIAIATTAEFTAARGGEANALASVQSFVDDLNEIFEQELAVHFDLVANNSSIIFTDSATDGYSESNDVGLLINENQVVIDNAIGNANYDIGHVFGHTAADGEGRGTLNSAGVDGLKGSGASVTSDPDSPGWVTLVGHEIGHQFGGQHTFNSNAGGSCVGSRTVGNAYEPASGSTLMSYAGICGADDLQDGEDPFFHSASFEQIETHIRGPGAPYSTTNNDGNAIPTVNGGADFTIPARTPFALAAVGSDTDAADTLTYSWEQLDLGPAMSLPLTDNGESPLFRSFAPTTNPSRVFPRLPDLVANVDTAPLGEMLPNTDRDLNFRVTVRDGIGGVNSDDVLLTVDDTGAAFVVTAPNTAVTWTGGSTQTITWNVASTNLAPISTSNVQILLSTDGGQTFPFALATTDNDGSHTLTLPNIDVSEARVKVAAVGNVFFDISNVDFTISSNPAAAGVALTESSGSTIVTEDGGVDSYTLALNTAPVGSVTVMATAGDQTQISVDGQTFSATQTLTFDSTAPQSVFVKALDDSKEGGHTGVISHAVSTSSSGAYPAGTLINQRVIRIVDNDSPPVVGVDLDYVSFGSAPTGWAHFELDAVLTPQVISNIMRDDGLTTNFDFELQFDSGSLVMGVGSSGASVSSTPQHIPTLDAIGGYNRGNLPLTATWSDLMPGRNYGVYVMGLDGDGTRALGQTVTITGESALPSFSQTLPDGQLFVNDSASSRSETLQTYEKVAVADSDGQISIRVVPTGEGFGLAGFALREILPAAPGIALTQSVTGTMLDEAGGTDTYTLALNGDPSGSVTIALDADTQSEISLDGVNFAASQTITASNTLQRTITVRAIDDHWLEGSHTSTISHVITASTSGTYPVTLGLDDFNVNVVDNEAFAPLVGVDFDSNTSVGARPTNWNNVNTWPFGGSVTHTDLMLESGAVSGIDLMITRPNEGLSHGPSVPSTASTPSHSPSLVQVGHTFIHGSTSQSIDFTWKDLSAETPYNVYAFTVESFLDVVEQIVTVTGSGIDDPSPFLQDTQSRDGVLLINGEDGSDARLLESFAVPVTSDGDGEIALSIIANSGLGVFLAGLAIQEAPPTPAGVTVTPSGGSTVLAEGGAADTYTIALDTVPAGAVEITITADGQSEISLNGVDFAATQVFNRNDTSAQTVTVRAAEDATQEGTHVSRITHAVTATADAANYPASSFIAPVTAIVTDNDVDTPTVTVDSLVTNDATPTITGTVSGGTLTVAVNGVTYTAGDGDLSIDGTNWTLTIPNGAAFGAGRYDVEAISTDGGDVGTDATTDELWIRPWQNPANRFNVNNDVDEFNNPVVSALDVLTLINAINNDLFPGAVLPNPTGSDPPPPPYYDVDGSGTLVPQDVLTLINAINAAAPSPPEGEAGNNAVARQVDDLTLENSGLLPDAHCLPVGRGLPYLAPDGGHSEDRREYRAEAFTTAEDSEDVLEVIALGIMGYPAHR